MNAARCFVLAAAAVALAGSAVPVVAAPPKATPTCNLVKDGEGDGGVFEYGGVTVNSPPLDIMTADIATGARTVVATIKVVSLDMDPQATPTATYRFWFMVKATEYNFGLVRDWQGSTEFSFSAGSATGSIDPATNTIKFSTARSNVKALAARGQKFTELRATSASSGSVTLSADSANAHPSFAYVDRTPSCLKPT